MSATVDATLTRLRSLGWLAAVEGHPPRYLLARAPETIDLEALSALADDGAIPPRCDRRARTVLLEVASQGQALWGGRTLADVLSSPA